MATVPVKVNVNGVEHSADIEARLLLVHFLRETLRLTGTHSVSGAAALLCAYLASGFAARAAITSRSVSFTEAASGNTSATSGSSSTTLQLPANLRTYLPRTPPLKS